MSIICLDNEIKNTLLFEQALDNIYKKITPIKEFVIINIKNSLGRVLFEDIRAEISVPNHTNSAMDGFAITKEDLNSNNKIEVIGTCYAGENNHIPKITTGKCLRIFTGAIIGENIDMVIPQEFCTIENKFITINNYKGGANIRQAGEDIKKGDIILQKGKLLNSSDIGLLASMGITKVKTIRTIKVAFFSTGDELCTIDKKLKKGQIYDSNRYMLVSLLKRANIEVYDMGIVNDDKNSIKDVLVKSSKKADIVLTTGGVSVGEADLVKNALEEVGEINFWKLAIKPGRPLAFGKINNSYFFGLPGNPVAVFVCFSQIVLPTIKYLANCLENKNIYLPAKCLDNIKKKVGRREFLRANSFVENNKLCVKIIKKQGSGVLSSVSQANCLMILKEQQQDIKSGDYVDIYNFSNLLSW